jgi:hypothetical protein
MIILAPSVYEFLQPDNFVDGANALPSVTSPITLQGSAASLRRSASARSLFRLLHVADGGSLVIVNLTIENGALDLTATTGYLARGGGVLSRGSLELHDSRLRNNAALFGGGALVLGGPTLVDHTAFLGNSAGDSSDPNSKGNGAGGGLLVLLSAGSIVDSTFVGNHSLSGGGAVYLAPPEYSTFLVDGTVFLLNQDATDNAGGIFAPGVDGAHITVDHSRFVANSAYKYGGVSLCGLAMTIRNSSFVANTSGAVGISCTNGGALVVANSTFAANQVIAAPGTVKDAGGITNAGGDVSIVNSTFSDNVGGAVANNTHPGGQGTMTIVHATVTGGFATSGAGGVTNYQDGVLNLANTIVANSLVSADCLNLGTIGVNIGNMVEDGSCGAGLAGDPKLAALADNGGPTQTHALFVGSPAIDAAAPTWCPPLDQRGVARPVGAGCDIGAYEGSKVPIERIRIDYLTKPKPYVVVCDPLQPETIVVALLGSREFDATAVQPGTVVLGSAAPGIGRLVARRDVNADGFVDVSMQWPLAAAYRGLDCTATTQLPLRGSTTTRVQFFAAVAVAPERTASR